MRIIRPGRDGTSPLKICEIRPIAQSVARPCLRDKLSNALPERQMTRVLLFGFAALTLLSACSSQLASSPYRPIHGDAQWLIDGEISPTYEGSFFVNGQLAAKGRLSNGFVRGSYNGHPVSVTCKHTKGLFSTDDDCDVFIDQELATRLHSTKNW